MEHNTINNMKKALLIVCLFISVIASGQGNFFWSHNSSGGYGYLYNWYAATDSRNITSSDDWSIPLMTEITTLLDYLGGSTTCGGKLKKTGFKYWNSPNTGATNEVGFNGVGGGIRSPDNGLFTGIKSSGTFFSRDVGALTGGFTLKFNSVTTDAGIAYTLKAGRQLRFFRLATVEEQLLIDGSTCPPYIGNDGRAYRTVKIGTQVWLANNLAETKYRNGDLIPVVTDNTAWTALTTGARCVYGNNESNK